MCYTCHYGRSLQRRDEAFPTSSLQPQGLAQAEEPQQPTHSLGMPHPYQRARLQSESLGAIVGNSVVALKDTPLLASDTDIYGQLWGNRIYVPLTLRSQ